MRGDRYRRDDDAIRLEALIRAAKLYIKAESGVPNRERKRTFPVGIGAGTD